MWGLTVQTGLNRPVFRPVICRFLQELRRYRDFRKTPLKICRNRPVGFRAEQAIRGSYGPGMGGWGVWVVGDDLARGGSWEDGRPGDGARNGVPSAGRNGWNLIGCYGSNTFTLCAAIFFSLRLLYIFSNTLMGELLSRVFRIGLRYFIF
jgi:hypothetical protein